MKRYHLVTYRAAQGPRAGIVVEEEVFDVAALTGRSSYATMLAILDDWEAAQAVLEKAAEIKDRKNNGIPLEKARLLVPVLYPPTIFCAGANYFDHLMEMAVAQGINPDPDPRASGLNPWHFIKASRSVVETQSTVPLPETSGMVDWEAELVAVVGRSAKNVSVDHALGYIAGYTVGNDLSARDLSTRPNVTGNSPFKYDWVSHKSFDGACPVGPWIVPAKEIPDPQ